MPIQQSLGSALIARGFETGTNQVSQLRSILHGVEPTEV